MEEEGDTVEYALINLVRDHPELYNPQSPGFKHKPRRDLAWAAIARELDKEEIWCYQKWRKLVDYYKRRKKVYNESGAGTCRASRWVYFDALSFLDQYDCRETFSLSEHDVNSVKSSDPLYEDGSNHPYFDETQYHSLDGISERAMGAGDTGGTVVQPQLGTLRLPDPLSECPPSKRRRLELPILYSTAQTSKAHEGANKGQVLMPPSSNPDCPHYHFCMSLAARFRNMEPASATYLQMKIMEVILKSEYPDEYERKCNASQ